MSLLLNGTTGITLPNGSIFAGVTDLTNATSDFSLAIGSVAIRDFTAVTTVPLYISTSDNSIYEIIINASGTTGSTVGTSLNPNNTTYTNFFTTQYSTTLGAAVGGTTFYASNFTIAISCDPRYIRVIACTKTASKSVEFVCVGKESTSARSSQGTTLWHVTASDQGSAPNTATAWTSLGTIVFPVANTGRVFIRRLA
jgi:hypothetical protein